MNKKIIHYLKTRKLIIALSLVYTLVVLTVLLHRFWQYEAFYYDHGMMEQTAYHLSRLQPPLHHREYGKAIYYIDHFLPSMQLVLAPFYWLADSYEAPIIAMSLYIGLSVLVAYEIASKIIKNKLLVYALLFGFMFYIGLQNALIFLVHDVTVQILFLMLLFWTIVANKKSWYYPFLILNLGFKESFAFTAVALGIAIILFGQKQWKKHGIITILVSFIYGLVVVKFIIPYFYYLSFGQPSACIYEPEWPDSLSAYFTYFVNTRLKRETIFTSLATFGFLPLFSPFSLVLLLQDWAQRFVLLAPNNPLRHGLNLHYNANLAVFLFVGSVLSLGSLQKKDWYQRLALGHALFIFFITAVFHRFIYHGPLGLIYNKDFFKITKNQQFMNDFVSRIPKKGKIMVQNNIAVRFTHDDLYLLLSEEVLKKESPDVIALDFRPGQNPNNYWPLNEEKMAKLTQSLLRDKNYQPIYQEKYRYIFVKKN